MVVREWRLVHEHTGEPINIGDFVLTFRKESGRVLGFRPPHKISSSGHANVDFGDYVQEVYPSVIKAKYIMAGVIEDESYADGN